MIDFKKTTQAYSGSPNSAGLRAENQNTLSADEAAKLLGENGDMGEYLNKLTNPNYVKPSRIRGTGKNELGKDDFLKLMLAQMKNQDPTNPLKSHEMAAQMAQFTSVEQLTNINQAIEKLGHNQNSGGTYDSLAFIGKVASGDSSKLFRQNGDTTHDFHFNLAKDAMNIKIQVKDAAGEVVKTLEVKDLKEGKNSVTWNGQTEDGLQARAGEYYFSVEARSNNGAKIHAETKFDGRISGVKFSPQGPILLIGNQSVALRDVQQIVDPSVLEKNNSDKNTSGKNQPDSAQGQKTSGEKTLDLKKNDNIQQNKNMAAQPPKGNIEDVPMSRGLINKLAKVTR